MTTFYDSPEEARAAATAKPADTSFQFYDSPEAARGEAAPTPVATRSSEQAGIIRAPQPAPAGPGVLETASAMVSGRPPPPGASLPVNVGASMIANAPLELGAAAGIARGAAAGARYGAPGGFWGGTLGGIGGGLLGAVAQDRFKEGQQTGTPFGLVPAFGGFDPSGGMFNALSAVAGGQGAPLVQRGLSAMWNRLTGQAPTPPPPLPGMPTALDPRRRGDALERAELSREFNVPYTYGELTRDFDQMGQEAVLRALPGSADPMEDFLRNRAVATQSAAQDIAEGISPATSAESFVRAGESAADALKGLRRKRSVVANRMYEKVWASGLRVPVGDMIENLSRRAAREEEGVQRVYNDVARQLRDAVDEQGTVPAQLVHNIQRRNTARAEELVSDNVLRETNRSVGLALKNRLEELSPDYRAASDAYRELSRPIESVERATRLGRLAKKDPVEFSTEVAGWFRGENAAKPEDIRNIKNVWRRTLPADRYRTVMDGLRSGYIKSAVDTIKPTEGGGPLNVAGKLARALGGDPAEAGGLRTRQMLQELYTPPQLAKIDRFLTLLDDTSKITSYGSATQPRQVAAQMRAAADELPTPSEFRTTSSTAWVLDKLYEKGRQWARRRFGVERREMEANRAYAEALNRIADAPVRQLDRISRAIQQAGSRPSERAESELLRAFGSLLGGGVGAENPPRRESPEAFVGGS